MARIREGEVKLFYTTFRNPLPEWSYEKYMQRLPAFVQDRIVRYKRWQDRQATLLGKVLLAEAMAVCDVNFDLAALQVDAFGRPSLDGRFDFNISHSGEFVVCACTWDARVGVDVEEVTEVDVHDFASVFLPEEFEVIRDSKSKDMFFSSWTRKEAVSKAIGRGLSLAFPEILLWEGGASYGDENFFVEEVFLDAPYRLAVASSCRSASLKVYEVNLMQDARWVGKNKEVQNSD